MSNEIRSKQFIRIFRAPDGRMESMVQRVYRQITAIDPEGTVTLATSEFQVSAIHNHLGQSAQISLEPCRRDTFPAIVLTAAYLHDKMGVDSGEPTCPSEKYGYIIPVSGDRVSSVSMFKEKPGEEEAKAYIARGALWNAGVFAFRISYGKGPERY